VVINEIDKLFTSYACLHTKTIVLPIGSDLDLASRIDFNL